jgi:hypothetical protein
MRLEIRNGGLDLGQTLRQAIERKLQFILGRFCSRIGRVTLYLANLDNTFGEMKVHCRIAIRLVPFGQVAVDVAAVDLDTALDWAAERIGPAVQRELIRWRDRRGLPAR